MVVSNNGTSFAQTISDESGNWSVSSSLPAGEVKITAKAVQNPAYGYFPSTPDLQNYQLNRIRLSDNVINPGGGGWPITSTAEALMLIPSVKSNFMYFGNPFIADSTTGKFVPSSGLDATSVSGYPSGAYTNKGGFSADDSKFYSVNGQLNDLTVIDTSTNNIIDAIDLGSTAVTAWTGPTGKLYVIMFNNQIKIINTDTDTIEKTVSIPCVVADSTATMTFSKDKNYPYYYVPCSGDGTLLKYKLSDDSLVQTLNVGLSPQSGALSLDNKRIFLTSRFGSPNSDKFRVVNAIDGSEIITKNLTAGALGFLETDDFQKIYIATPGNNVDVANIDVLDTETYEVTPVPTGVIAGAVTTLPSETSEAAIDVTFVLGATTATPASSNLGETGAAAVSATLLLGLLIGTISFLYYDYRQHKKPLIAINPDVRYTFVHHVKVVSIPLLRYRLTFSLEKKRSNIIGH